MNISSTSRILVCVLLVLSAVASASSQSNPGKPASGSISGKVTVKNKGVAGIVVFANDQNSTGWNRSVYRGTTDQTGSYRITNIPAGTYRLVPMAPALAFEDELVNNSVAVSDGETVEDMNFAMVQGGVITGRVTDADGKPLIEQSVTVFPIDPTLINERLGEGVRTDDRGIYRIFGLRKGKYKVSVGREYSLSGVAGRSYRKTFYPSVNDIEKATVVEVTEGSEAKDINIVVGRPLPVFKVSGRIVHGETGKPLPGIKFGVHQNIDANSSQSTIGRTFTNANGEFSLENLLPGKYSIFIVPEESGVRGASVPFEVVDRDVTDLVIKAASASSVSGVVVLEGAEETAPAFNFRHLYLNAWVESSEAQFNTNYSIPIKPDGTFTVNGLPGGNVHFRFAARTNSAKQLALVRIERDGVPQPQGITLKEGEQVSGLRLVIKHLTGVIHGQIKVEGDELLPTARMSVWITPVDENRSGQFQTGGSSPLLDSRRRFVAEGLAAGTYEVNVSVYDPNRHDTNRVFKQQVTVTDNVVSEVTVVIKMKP